MECWTPPKSSQSWEIFNQRRRLSKDARCEMPWKPNRKNFVNKPKRNTALSDEVIDILYSKKLLGLSSPQAPVNTVWLNNMLHFGLRGYREQRELQWGDVVLKSDRGGKQYLEYFVTRQKMTRNRENSRNQRQVSRVCRKTKPPSLLNATSFRFTKSTEESAQKRCCSPTHRSTWH